MTDHTALIADARTLLRDSEVGSRVDRTNMIGHLVDALEDALASVPALPTQEQIAKALYYHWLGTAAALEWNAWESKHPATKAPWHEIADAILSLLTNSKED